MNSTPSYLDVLRRPAVLKRGCLYAVVVGSVLIGINHGDALLRGDVTPNRILKMILTVVVPFVVSTTSSVAAIRSTEPKP